MKICQGIEKKLEKPKRNPLVPYPLVCLPRADELFYEYHRRNATPSRWSKNEYLLYFFIVLFITIVV